MKEKAEKNNRFEETRYFETRNFEQDDDQIRRNIEMSWKDPFYIDPSIVPDGMVYSFKREYFLKAGGEEDKGRIAESFSKGWTPVPPERHPHIHVKRGGQILMERQKRHNDYELEYLNRATHEQIHSNEALRGHSPFMQVNRNMVTFGTHY